MRDVWRRIAIAVERREACDQLAHPGFALVHSTSRDALRSYVDDVVWIWYYDRQGCIQSEGINFVQDLPTFLVLLVAFQRFTLDDWGFNTELNDIVAWHCSAKGRSDEGPKRLLVVIEDNMIELDGTVIHSTYGIRGRGTGVFRGTMRDKTKSGEKKAVVLKVYSPEVSRLNEVDIIKLARERAGGKTSITNHLPEVHCSKDDKYTTGAIREALGIASESQARVPRYMVSALLEPITVLAGRGFVQAWFECVRCKWTSFTVVCEVLMKNQATMSYGSSASSMVIPVLAT